MILSELQKTVEEKITVTEVSLKKDVAGMVDILLCLLDPPVALTLSLQQSSVCIDITSFS
jgi:hypothetical protein